MRVYLASKIKHGDTMFDFHSRLEEEGHIVTSQWYLNPFKGMSEEPAFARMFWKVDEKDVASSNVVIVYSENDNDLRGALVEAGMALATGKVVILIGESESFGTWQYHPRVFKLEDLYEIPNFLEGLQKLWRG